MHVNCFPSPSDINDEYYLVTRVGLLLLRILRMWLVCQLLINRHQVGEGNLDREKGNDVTLKPIY